MEDFLQVRTSNTKGTREVSVDNSTEFKDFLISDSDSKGVEEKSIDFMLDCSTNTKTLRVGSFTLSNRQLELLKEFISQ